jgi:hypothetical protein
VKLDRIASARITDFYEPGDRLKEITLLPPCLADAVRKVEFHDNGTVKQIELHDKARALTVLLKRLGGLADERPVEVTNTQVNIAVADERRATAVLPARTHAWNTIDCDSAQEPTEQSPTPIRKPH